MAVTQLLVRIPEAEVLRCSADGLALLELISFPVTGPDDELDLDWGPSSLARLAAVYGRELVNALQVLLDGTAVVNPELAEGPPYDTVYSEIRRSTPSQVAAAAAALERVEVDALLRALPLDLDEARKLLECNELPLRHREYYADHFRQLRDFAKGAAERGLAMAMWWD